MPTSSVGSRGVALASLAVLAIAPALLPLRALAQDPPVPVPASARLQGIVVLDATDRPVDRATVTLIGTPLETRTGPSGDFTFPAAPLGTLSLRVSAAGHPSIVENIEISAAGEVFVQIRLPSVDALLAEILVLGTRGPSDVGTAQTAADLLALRVPSARATPGVVGNNNGAVHLRGATSITQTLEPLVLVDGVVVSRGRSALDALALIRASDVEQIQVLSGAAAASLYPFAANGVILVTTKRGN